MAIGIALVALIIAAAACSLAASLWERVVENERAIARLENALDRRRLQDLEALAVRVDRLERIHTGPRRLVDVRA